MSFKWTRLGEDELRRIVVLAVRNHSSMAAAAASIPMNYQTFRKHAKKFNVWQTNQPGKGIQKSTSENAIPLNEILNGQHRSYTRGSLKRRLLRSGLKKNECEHCGLKTWHGKMLTMHLDHINGDSWDHRFSNLRMLCPNCHSQTTTYCGRNARVVERQTHPV